MNVFARGAQVAKDPRPQAISTAQIDLRQGHDASALVAALGPGPFGLVILFVSPQAPLAPFLAKAVAELPETPVVACTTAGEIGAQGYQEDQAVAIGLPADGFSVHCELIEDLAQVDLPRVTDNVIQARLSHAQTTPQFDDAFAFLLVDGLSRREDVLVAAIARGLGSVPLFGGSAADGTRFVETKVALGSEIRSDAAVLCLVRSNRPTRVFTLDHLRPGTQRMVVTEADPEQRIVKTINAEPAAREYARLVGKDPNQLSAFTFAENPVVVRIGGTHHVRAIQRVTDEGALVFFSAIDEGMVLTVAETDDLPRHLDRELGALGTGGPPEAIIGCDCILRRIEAEQSQAAGQVSDVLARHRVFGFSTYGEQFGPLHVNHTMTGVAIYPAKQP